MKYKYIFYTLTFASLFLTLNKSIHAIDTTRNGEVIYSVKRGDTLWSIALLHYGSGELYPIIVQKNKLSNPSLIHQGNMLRIDTEYPLRSIASIKTVDDIYTGVEYTLPVLPPGHPVRLQLEQELKNEIQDAIHVVRSNGDKQFASLLLNAISEDYGYLWVARRGRIIGQEGCRNIFMEVASDMKFTLEEAKKYALKSK